MYKAAFVHYCLASFKAWNTDSCGGNRWYGHNKFAELYLHQLGKHQRLGRHPGSTAELHTRKEAVVW